MNKEIRSYTQINQWKNSPAVIKWFNNIENKPNPSFMVFNIQNF